MKKGVVIGIVIGVLMAVALLACVKLLSERADAQVASGSGNYVIMTPGVPEDGRQPIYVLMRTGAQETLLVYEYGRSGRTPRLTLSAARTIQYDKLLTSLNTTPSIDAVYKEAMKLQQRGIKR